jgi:hypothetical protein
LIQTFLILNICIDFSVDLVFAQPITEPVESAITSTTSTNMTTGPNLQSHLNGSSTVVSDIQSYPLINETDSNSGQIFAAMHYMENAVVEPMAETFSVAATDIIQGVCSTQNFITDNSGFIPDEGCVDIKTNYFDVQDETRRAINNVLSDEEEKKEN